MIAIELTRLADQCIEAADNIEPESRPPPALTPAQA